MKSKSELIGSPATKKLKLERVKLVESLSKYQESAAKTRSVSAISDRINNIDKILKDKSKLPVQKMAHALNTNQKFNSPTNLDFIPEPIRKAVADNLESQGRKQQPVLHSPQVILNRIDKKLPKLNQPRILHEQEKVVNENIESVRKQYEGIIEQMKKKNEEELKKQKTQLDLYKTAVDNSNPLPPHYTGTIPKRSYPEPQQRNIPSDVDTISVDSYLQFSTEAFSPRKNRGKKEPKPIGSSTEYRPRNRQNVPSTLQPQLLPNHNNPNSEIRNIMPFMQQFMNLLQTLPQQKPTTPTTAFLPFPTTPYPQLLSTNMPSPTLSL